MQRLQRADKLLGALAFIALQPLRWLRDRADADRDPARVLVIKFWGIGSIQLLTPAVECLRRRHPDARIELLTLSQNARFAEGLGLFDQVRTLDVSGVSWPRLVTRILGLVERLRAERYDLVYDFEFFTRFSAVVSLLTGAPRTRGFSSPSVWRGGLHTETVPFNRYWHVARNFRCLAGGENGVAVQPGDVRAFEPTEADRAELDTALTGAGLLREGPLVVVNPNAGSLSLERRWPRERFAELVSELIRVDGARVVLVGAPGEREWTGGVTALLADLPSGRFANLCGELSIGSLHALLARAALFVGNDSGPMHLAAATGAPTIGLFGPETPHMYAPLGPRVRALYEPPPCSPCINVHDNKVSSCIHGRPECLMNISVEAVTGEARSQLKRNSLRTLDERRAE